MRRPAPPFLFRAALAAGLLAAAACTDHDPAGLPKASPEPAPPPALTELRCTADVRAGTLGCIPAGATAAPGVSAALIGGQGTNVQLRSSGTSYDGTAILRTDMTLTNLTAQALGTADGTTPSPDGVRVFFHSGPSVTGGNGAVEVENADGEAAFTRGGQPYFQYDGILAPGDSTPAKEWRFLVPPSVATFAFTVYVAAAVRSETGWIALSPVAPSLVVGDTQRLAATLRSIAGHALPGQPVAWATTNAGVATVNADGVVTGVAPGTATITATGGGRTASVEVRVFASTAASLPALVGLEMSRASMAANGSDTVTFRVTVRDAGEGVSFVSLVLGFGTTWAIRGCSSASVPVSGTPHDGVYECRVFFPEGYRDGAWHVAAVGVSRSTTFRSVNGDALLAAGVPVHLYLDSPNPDLDPPVIQAFGFSPDSATPVVDSVTIDVAVADPGVGALQVQTTFRTALGNRLGCMATRVASGTPFLGVYRCRMGIPGYLSSVTALVESVRLWDRNGNYTEITEWDLAAAGAPTELFIGPEPGPPQITAFSFSPATVAANGVDSVTVSLTATDAHSGVKRLEMQFRKVGGEFYQVRSCDSGTLAPQPSRTFTCKLRFGAGDTGTWRVEWIRAVDLANHQHSLTTGQMQAVPYPTELTVTP